MTARVAAVVLAARDRDALEAALGSVAWAASRVVLDSAGRAGGFRLPAGVERVTGSLAPHLAGADWALLLADDERVSPALAAALAAATAAPGAYAIPRALAVGDRLLRLPGAPVRLVPVAAARLADLRDGVLAWETPPAPRRRLAEPLVVCDPGSLEAAVGELDEETTALAALAAGDGVVRWRDALLAPGAASARVLAARGARLGWERWIRAVLAGYRVVVLHAKRWERAREAPL